MSGAVPVDPGATTTPVTFPRLTTTLLVPGVAEPLMTQPILDWRRGHGLTGLTELVDVVRHDGRLNLVGRDGDGRTLLFSSVDGASWAPVAVPESDGSSPTIQHLVSAGRDLVAVGTITGEDQDDEVVGTWWRGADGAWLPVLLPQAERPEGVEHDLVGELDRFLEVTGAVYVDGALVVSASDHLTNRSLATSEAVDIPQWWRDLERQDLAFVSLQPGRAVLYVEPFPVDAVPLESGEVPSVEYARTEMVMWRLEGPGSEPTPPDLETGVRLLGIGPDGAYGVDSGRLVTSPDGRQWTAVIRTVDVNGGNEAVPFSGGWMRAAGDAISFSPDGSEWAFASPRPLVSDGFVSELTGGQAGVVALISTFLDEPPEPVVMEVDDRWTIRFERMTGTLRIESPEETLLHVTLQWGRPDDGVARVDGRDLQFVHPARDEVMASVPIQQWVDAWRSDSVSWSQSSVVHSRDGIAWSVQPVSEIASGTAGHGYRLVQAGEVVVMSVHGQDTEIWIGRLPTDTDP